jgi:pyruvate,water dikinase
MLLENQYNEQELLDRTKYCVYYAERGAEKIFIGSEAREIMKSIEKEVDTNISELKGESGCVGYAKGKVKIIIRAEDMDKMEEGDILVSIATDPDIVPAMKKAAGIITEQGGVTSHAAIVSRELGIPCVIGTKIATKVLKDGDLVEVDANKGIVKKII